MSLQPFIRIIPSRLSLDRRNNKMQGLIRTSDVPNLPNRSFMATANRSGIFGTPICSSSYPQNSTIKTDHIQTPKSFTFQHNSAFGCRNNQYFSSI
ncbi:hypothetical protein V6Z12_D04G063600 [Gossypium hirsutum]